MAANSEGASARPNLCGKSSRQLKRVIFYDQPGCGRSDRPDDITLCTVDRFVTGLAQVRAALGFERLHLFGSCCPGGLPKWETMDRLPAIRVPTLLVGGRPDKCTPGHLQDTPRRIAGLQPVVIEDASHPCFAGKPAKFNQVMNSFLDRTDPGAFPVR